MYFLRKKVINQLNIRGLNLIKLATFFRVSIDELLGLDDKL